MNSFYETAACKHRLACYPCRNEPQFRRSIEAKYGPIECPAEIEIGTPVELLPAPAQRVVAMRDRETEASESQEARLKESLRVIYELVPEDQRRHVVRLWHAVAPRDLRDGGELKRTTQTCQHAGAKVGKVERICCGGRKRMVDLYACELGLRATEPDCRQCEHHLSKDPKQGAASVGTLVLMVGCDDCTPVKELLREDGWFGHREGFTLGGERFAIYNALSEDDALKMLGSVDAELPVLLLEDGSYLEGSEAIVTRLQEWGVGVPTNDGVPTTFLH